MAHAALQDSVFENMTMRRGRSPETKVQGLWNLHQQLPEDLDFLSSFRPLPAWLAHGANLTMQEETHFRTS